MTRIEQIVEVAKQKEKEEGFSEIVRDTKGIYSAYGIGFLEGAMWADGHLWKPADGDDLPEIDREVIVLTQHYPLENSEYAVYFAHRPNPDGWGGKGVSIGEIEHYAPKTYGKGGWSVSDVKYWLDIKFPNEQRGYERIRRIER